MNLDVSTHWHRAVLGVTLAVACFAALDSITKLVGTVVPLAMVVWSRYASLTLMTAAAQMPRHGWAVWRTAHLGLQVLRGACLVGCSAFAFLSLQHMAVGEFTAVVMLTPLVITAAAARALGERVSLWRWACVLGGFVGALVVIRPHSEDFNPSLLFPLGLVVTNAAYQVLTSRLARMGESATSMQLYTGAVGLGLASLLLPWYWQNLAPVLWAWLALLGVLGLAGHQFLIGAYRHAPASSLTPFLYLQIAFAMLMGWLLFNQVPDGPAWLGVGLIAICGVGGTWLAIRDSAAARAVVVDEPLD